MFTWRMLVRLADHALEVDANFDQGLTLQSAVAAESKRVDTALRSGESMMASQRYDEAVAAVADFRFFADEEPRISAIIDAAYKTHLDRGKANASSQKWREAVQEYQKAVDLKPTSEATSALKKAQGDLQSFTNRSAADVALQQSAAFEQDKRLYRGLRSSGRSPRYTARPREGPDGRARAQLPEERVG